MLRVAMSTDAAPDSELARRDGEAGASTSFSRPPEVGDIERCNMWYYVDSEGYMQGPFDSSQMRSWTEAGYIPVDTPVSPSHFGEVPTELWPVSVLWERPAAAALG